MTLTVTVVFLFLSLPFLVSSNKCNWSSSLDFNYTRLGDNSYYRLHVQNWAEKDIYKSTYFQIERVFDGDVTDYMIISLEEAEFFIKFVKSPSISTGILKSRPRNFHLSLVQQADQELIQLIFMYPRFSSIKYIPVDTATEIGLSFEEVIPNLFRCSKELNP